jgi:hypothetical protein
MNIYKRRCGRYPPRYWLVFLLVWDKRRNNRAWDDKDNQKGYCYVKNYFAKLKKNPYTIAPVKYPKSASGVIFLRYQKKSIFAIPIAATPAADPIISALPPVPAQYDKNDQKWWSVVYCDRGYIFIAAATSGTSLLVFVSIVILSPFLISG